MQQANKADKCQVGMLKIGHAFKTLQQDHQVSGMGSAHTTSSPAFRLAYNELTRL